MEMTFTLSCMLQFIGHENKFDTVEKNRDRKFRIPIRPCQVLKGISESELGTSDTKDNLEGYDNEAVIDEVRELYQNELPKTISEYSEPVPEKIDVLDVEEAINQMPGPSEDEMTKQKNTGKFCVKCFTKVRVETVKSFSKGQHLSFPGKKMTFNIRRKLKSLYNHHAIIIEVRKTYGHKAELILIHYTEVEEGIGIHETKETFDLENDEIYIVEYFRPRHNPDDIIRRAKSMLSKTEKDFVRYNVLTKNCEHFACWCVVGQKESFQVRGLLNSIASFLNNCSGVGCKIARFVMRVLYNASDEIADGFKVGLHLPGIVLGGTVVVYLVYCCVMTTIKAMKYKNCNLCKTCLKREVIGLWTTFGTFVAASGFSYIIVHFCLPLLGSLACPVGIPCLLALVVLSIGLQWGITQLRKSLMSPYSCEANPVSRLSDINVGDMISFRYYWLRHTAIVTEVRSENMKSTVGSIYCVHYGLKSGNIFGTRVVIEEDLQVDLNKMQIKLYDYRHLNRYSPKQVVERARKRLGERKWNPLYNNSDQLCSWALVCDVNVESFANAECDDIGESHTKNKSSLRFGQDEVHLREDVLPGQVVKYERNHQDQDEKASGKRIGIVVRLEDTRDRQFGMHLVVYHGKVTKRIRYNVDLQTDRLFIKKYHPAHCCSMEERVQRACQGCDERFKYNGEENFIESCILKK